MSPELWVGIVAVFVSGGAIGAAGTLLAQWLVKRVQAIEVAEVDLLRAEITELSRHLHNLDERLDFTERLLDGALPHSPPPERLTDTHPQAAD